MKVTFIICLLFLFSACASAQFRYIGITGGFNLAALHYESGSLRGYDIGSRQGFNAGLFTEYDLSGALSLRADVRYTQRGTEYKSKATSIGNIPVPDHKFIPKLDFIEIPVTLYYSIPAGFAVTPQIFLGPEISFLSKAELEYRENDKKVLSVDAKDMYKTFEFGVVIGAGAAYYLNNGKITFDIRYNYGITEINSDTGPATHQSNFCFNLGYGAAL